ncbi:MAG: DUF1214 domain-containing protein [Pseudomonadales bacterium]
MSDSISPANPSRRHLFKGIGIGAVVGALGGYAGGRLGQRDMVCLDQDLPADATEAEKALRDLQSTLNAYDQDYIHRGFVAPNSTDIADAYRYLQHLLATGIELFVEGDPERPEMAQIVSPTRKLMGDNADAYYFHASILGDRNYIVRGKNTGEVYISMTLHTGTEPGSWATGVANAVNSQQFTTDENGSWSILIGPNVSGPNTVTTTADTVSIISRHYYMNETYAAADPDIQPVIRIQPEQPVAPPPLPDDASIARKIRSLDGFIRANSIDRPLMNPLDTPDWFSLIPNTMGQPAKWVNEKGGGGWGALDNAYSAGLFQLSADEALIIKGKMPGCLFANVLLWNKYLQSLDYRYRQVSLNKRQMEIAEDGSFTIVVAHQDPGHKNWLDTEGREGGIVYWRFLLPEGDIDALETKLVKFSQL